MRDWPTKESIAAQEREYRRNTHKIIGMLLGVPMIWIVFWLTVGLLLRK